MAAAIAVAANSAPDPIDWVDSNLSRHFRMALLAATRPLAAYIDIAKDRQTRPVVPLGGGREVWRIDLAGSEDHPLLAVTRMEDLETRMHLPYGEIATYDLLFRRLDYYKRRIALTGRLTPGDHALLLTAFAGQASGVELSAFLPAMDPTRQVHLRSMDLATPLLVGEDGTSPFFEQTLDDVMARIRDSFEKEDGIR